MSKNNIHIDNLFNKGLSEYGEDMPFYVWDEIEARLKEKKRKKMFLYISGIAASIAIILSVFTFIFLNTSNKLLYSNNKQTKKVEIKKNSSQKIMVDLSLKNKIISAESVGKQIAPVINESIKQNQSIALNGKKNNSIKLKTGININSNFGIVTNNEVASSVAKHDTTSIQNNERKNDHSSEIVQSNKSGLSKGTAKDSLNNKTQFKIDFLKDISNDDKTTSNQNSSNNLFTNNTSPDKSAKKTKHNWEIGSHFASGVNTNIYKSNNTLSANSGNNTIHVDSGMAGAIGPNTTKGTNYKTNSVIYSTGLGLKYNIGKRWGLNAGFNYEVFQNNFFAVDYNNIKIIETPLTFSYAIINRKFIMGPTAGMGCDFYINMKNKMFFGLLGLDFEYNISKKFNISFVPAYKKDISNITGYKNHTFNLNIGLNYRL